MIDVRNIHWRPQLAIEMMKIENNRQGGKKKNEKMRKHEENGEDK